MSPRAGMDVHSAIAHSHVCHSRTPDSSQAPGVRKQLCAMRVLHNRFSLIRVHRTQEECFTAYLLVRR